MKIFLKRWLNPKTIEDMNWGATLNMKLAAFFIALNVILTVIDSWVRFHK